MWFFFGKQTVVGILQQLVLELKMDPETLTEDEKKSDEALSVKTKKLMVRNKKRMAEREQYRKVLSSDYHSLFRFFPPTSKSLSFSCFFLKPFLHHQNNRKHGTLLGCSS